MMPAYDKVKIARKVSRPTALDYIEHIFEGFIELHGDRGYHDDKAVVGGIAFLGDIPVTVIGIQKGKNMETLPATSVSPTPRATGRLSG